MHHLPQVGTKLCPSPPFALVTQGPCLPPCVAPATASKGHSYCSAIPLLLYFYLNKDKNWTHSEGVAVAAQGRECDCENYEREFDAEKAGDLKAECKIVLGEAVKLLAIAVGISIPCLSLISVGRVSFKNRLYL